MRCPLTGDISCGKEIEPEVDQYFLAYPYKPQYEDLEETVTSTLAQFRYTSYKATDEIDPKHILCKICKKMQESTFGIFEVSERNPNVMFELGTMYGLGKPVLLLRRSDSKRVISDLGGVEYIVYDNYKQLSQNLLKAEPALRRYAEDLVKTMPLPSPEPEPEVPQREPLRIYLQQRKRGGVLKGITQKVRTGCGALYVTLNSDEFGLCEILLQMGKSGGCAASTMESIARTVSLSLRSGVDPKKVAEELRGIRCPSPLLGKGGITLSCSDGLAKVLKGFESLETKKSEQDVFDQSAVVVGVCPDCGAALRKEEDVVVCRTCGYSESK